jgi:hypothetical protein
LAGRVIQDGEEKDKEGILALRAVVFKEEEPDKQKEAFWTWQFKENPDGKALIYLYKEGGQVVGHFADIPKRFVLEGKEILGTLSLDMMVHPEYRGGMFLQLGRYAAEKTKEKGFAFLTSFPIRKWSIKSLRRVGWKDFFKLPVVVYPLRFRGIVNRYIHFYPLSLLIGGIVRGFYCISIFAGRRRVKREIDVDLMTQCDDAFDQFWRRASFLHPLMGVRDRRFMTWRYFEHPMRTYTIYRAMKEGEMQGYIVLRKVDLLNFNSAVIVDLLALEENALRRLIEMGIEYGKKENADLLGCIVPRHHVYYKILRRRGFLASFKNFLFMVYPHIEKGVPLIPEGWYVNWGDSDVV